MSTPDAPLTPVGPAAALATPAAPADPTATVLPDATLPDATPSSPYGVAGGPATLPPRRSGLAVAAFVVGLLSVLVCAIPVINLAALVGGVVAVVLAIVALRKLVPGVTGKGLAIAGLVLGAVSVAVAVVVSVLLAMAAQSFDAEEFEALLEEVEAAEESGVAGDGPQALPAEEPAAEAAPVEAAPAEPAPDAATDVAREDFSDLTCDLVALEAVAMSAEAPEEGVPALVDLRESAAVEDHRADYAVPAGTDESLVLSCRGTGTWADGTESPVLTEVTINGTGEVFVAYAGE